MVLRKATKLETWKSGLELKKKNSDRKVSDGEVVGPKFLHIQHLRIHGSSIGRIRFSFWSSYPLTFKLDQIFTKKLSKSAKGNLIFHLKGRRDKFLFWKSWIALWLNFFLQNSFFFYFGHLLLGGRRGQSWTKSENSGHLPFLQKFEFFKDS